MQEFFANLVTQLRSLQIGINSVLEVLILAFLIYHLLLWIKNTRTWFLFKGVSAILVFILVANILEWNVIVYLAEKSLSILVIALLIIFQPDLRSALEQLGQRNYIFNLFTPNRLKEDAARHNREVTDELVKAAFTMGRAKTGALITLQREINLDEYVKTGIEVDAVMTSALLINIFEKNTPLHDGAVIMRGNRVVAATCYLPLSANRDINKDYGTRHRAAIGISEETDSLTIVVSEETGAVSLAVGGVLKHDLTPEELRAELEIMEKLPENPVRSFRFTDSVRSFRKLTQKEHGEGSQSEEAGEASKEVRDA